MILPLVYVDLYLLLAINLFFVELIKSAEFLEILDRIEQSLMLFSSCLNDVYVLES